MPRPAIGVLREWFVYDPAEGIIRWRPCRTGSTNRMISARVGKPAGSIGKDGYLIIGITDATGRVWRLQASHVAWALARGAWPPDQVDHRNLDVVDNRLDNLRLATASQNAMNRRVNPTSRIGIKGIFYTRYGCYAEVRSLGLKRRRGPYRTREEAVLAYAEIAPELHGEFARTT